jgi:hypothetical protein
MHDFWIHDAVMQRLVIEKIEHVLYRQRHDASTARGTEHSVEQVVNVLL